MPGWRNSLNDPDKWEIIEYKKFSPIFELLPCDLKEEVQKVFGQRILYGKQILVSI